MASLTNSPFAITQKHHSFQSVNSLLRKQFMPKLFRQTIAIILFTIFNSWAAASQFVAVSPDIKTISGLDTDVMVTVTPNIAQISYSKLSSFSVDRPLKIMNTSDAHGIANGKVAKLIVINADYINLLSSIELVGETADLLLISSNQNYSINCASCSFTNFGRVTIALATPTLDTNNNPGILNLLSAGTLTVNNLSTSVVASLELIAKSVSVNGKINTQLRASYTSDGSYQINPNGSLIVGAGGVNIFAGFNIDYATLTLKKPVAGASLVLPSTCAITTQAVHIASAAPLILSGIINTTSDAVSTANYRSRVAAIEESIEIYALNDNTDISLNGTLSSDNIIDIQGAGNININGNIKTKTLKMIAGNKIVQRGTSEFISAVIAASALDNNGKMMGRTLQIATKQELQNRFGGKLLADDIQLSSQYGAVRNGSQYPFKPKDDLPLVLRPDSPTDIHFGTINGIPFTGATKVSDLSAAILGKTITITAASNVENINPYIEYTLDTKTWANGVTFNQDKASQVQLVADNTLKIGSTSFVLNSSAVMGVNNPEGKFIISAPYITNERYNTQAVVQPFESTPAGSNITTTGTESALMVFSPPGIIYSFSPLSFYFTIKTGGFINNTAYFEVLNNATFTSNRTANEPETSKVTSIGLALQQQLNGQTITKTWTLRECQAAAGNDEGKSRACTYNLATPTYTSLSGAIQESMRGTLSQ